MRSNLFLVLTALVISLTTQPLLAQTNEEIKTEYVIKNLKLNKATSEKFRPVCLAYFNDMKAAKAEHSALKSKYKEAVKAGQLTNKQAEMLVKAHRQSDHKELAVKEKYYPLFLEVLSAKQTYFAFEYAGDSMKKINAGGRKSSNNEDED